MVTKKLNSDEDVLREKYEKIVLKAQKELNNELDTIYEDLKEGKISREKALELQISKRIEFEKLEKETRKVFGIPGDWFSEEYRRLGEFLLRLYDYEVPEDLSGEFSQTLIFLLDMYNRGVNQVLDKNFLNITDQVRYIVQRLMKNYIRTSVRKDFEYLMKGNGEGGNFANEKEILKHITEILNSRIQTSSFYDIFVKEIVFPSAKAGDLIHAEGRYKGTINRKNLCKLIIYYWNLFPDQTEFQKIFYVVDKINKSNILVSQINSKSFYETFKKTRQKLIRE